MSTTKALADPLRVSILRILATDSFAVLELSYIVDIPQPALSHHLKILLKAGLVNKRREGNSLFYRRALAGGDQLKSALLAAVDTLPVDPDFGARVAEVQAAHQRQSRAFFEAQGPEFHNGETAISPPGAYAEAVMDMLSDIRDRQTSVLEIGPGTGEMLKRLAAKFEHVVGIDQAAPMLEPARSHTAALKNVTLRTAGLEDIPGTPLFNVILAAMVVHHQASPSAFFQQAARRLQTGGRLLIVELCPHDQEWVKTTCGDRWLGFDPEQLIHWAQAAALTPGESQFLAQKNGFQLQIHAFHKE